MALVSGGRSSLNPNAPLFVPAAMRQVEDFSPEWWNLVTTSTWFRDYWLSQQEAEDMMFYEEENDVVQMLPDSIDLGVDEDILNMEAQFEEFLQSTETEKAVKDYGFGRNVDALVKTLNMPMVKSPREHVKYWEKPARIVSPKCGPRFIQQPR